MISSQAFIECRIPYHLFLNLKAYFYQRNSGVNYTESNHLERGNQFNLVTLTYIEESRQQFPINLANLEGRK